MELTLAVWKPKNELIPLRHTWIDGEKQKPAFDTHYSISDYRTHDKIDRDWITFQFTKIRSGNTGEGFGQAIPELSKKKLQTYNNSIQIHYVVGSSNIQSLLLEANIHLVPSPNNTLDPWRVPAKETLDPWIPKTLDPLFQTAETLDP